MVITGQNNMFVIIGEGKIYNCGIFNMAEIQIIEIDKRLSRMQPDYVDY
jgi:hypothetical protein